MSGITFLSRVGSDGSGGIGGAVRSMRERFAKKLSCTFQRVILELLRVAMVGIPNTKGFIVDGFPREMEQGKEFENEVSMGLSVASEMCLE